MFSVLLPLIGIPILDIIFGAMTGASTGGKDFSITNRNIFGIKEWVNSISEHFLEQQFMETNVYQYSILFTTNNVKLKEISLYY